MVMIQKLYLQKNILLCSHTGCIEDGVFGKEPNSVKNRYTAKSNFTKKLMQAMERQTMRVCSEIQILINTLHPDPSMVQFFTKMRNIFMRYMQKH